MRLIGGQGAGSVLAFPNSATQAGDGASQQPPHARVVFNDQTGH